MPIEFSCECGKRLKVSDEFAGRKVKCPECGTVLTAPGGSTAPRAEEPPRSRREPDDEPPPRSRPHDEEEKRPRRWEEDEEKDRPRRSQREEDEDEDRPRRSQREEDEEEDRPRRSRREDSKGRSRRSGSTETSGKAITALVLSVLSFCCVLLTSIPAVILALLSFRDIRQGMGRVTGTGLAWTSLILSGVSTVAWIVGFLWAWPKIQEAAERAQGSARMLQISLAMSGTALANGHEYPDHIRGPNQQPLLSWRVRVLQYGDTEHQKLYRRFNLNEPWDSPTNRPLLDAMPDMYAPPPELRGKLPSGHTFYRVVGGRSGLYAGGRPLRMVQITDGSSNTIVLVEAAESVPWTQPEELAFDVNAPLPKLGSGSKKQFQVLFGDFSVRTFSEGKYNERDLRGYLTPNGGEVVPRPQ